jgi:hypothetical protein
MGEVLSEQQESEFKTLCAKLKELKGERSEVMKTAA